MLSWVGRHKWLVIAVAAALVIAGSAAVPALRGKPVTVARAQVADIELRVATSGKVETESSDLSLRASGEILDVYVSEGDPVQRTQVLARIARLQPAAAVPSGDDALKAPFDGQVVTIYLRQGAVAQAGTPVMRVVSSLPPWVTAFVDSDDAAHMRPGQVLRCRSGGYLSPPWDVRIVAVGEEAVPRPDIQGSASQVRVRCEPVDPGFAIPPGTEVDIDAELPLAENVLTVPASAVAHDGPESWVWVVEDGEAHRRPVEIGVNNFDVVRIVSGISAGDRVVVKGKEDLSDGQRVDPTDAEAEAGSE
jgi:multidrug efflux pump subunit AcrA (membrane-fusion protein)